ncbi:DMT family transporter [Thermoproteus tenax]|uniref:Permease of the drug/metabolite transporter superfamily n=1 Tax=Thermoproteus tenax (strain ATCC 35583 / DSM 2078 / JCM 9277 / NBRC 100435 / Kra 1) TaxID=768679 RepID=G4RNC3_THETK|nr:EamA family transporter [Thermoproteus tenax]CCC81067.1 permease of the drug/metabolite transporter superfamily [Thermoproteus tenax Kra 1]
MARRTDLKGVGYSLFSVVAWSTNYLVGRALGTAGVDPLGLTFIRFAIATPILFLMAGLPKYKGQLKDLAISGLLGVALFNALLYSSLHFIDAATASLFVIFSSPITYILGVALGAERAKPVRSLGVALSVLGAYLILAPRGSGEAPGALLALGSAVSWSLYTLRVGGLYKRYRPVEAMAWSSLLGTAAMALTLPIDDLAIPLSLAPLVVYIAVVPGALAYASWNSAVESMGPSAAYMLPLLPAITSALSWIALGEALTNLQMAGMALAIAGVYLANAVNK